MTTQTPVVTGTDFITVATRDFAAAAQFYGNVLGLPLAARCSEEPAGEFETGTLTIMVMESEAFGIEFRPNKHPIAFRVEDVAAARSGLEARGVKFKGETIDTGVCHQAFFEDPDGNALSLHHRYESRD